VKTRLFFAFFLLSLSLSVALAKTHPKVTEFALKHCSHKILPNEDDRIDCVTDIVNCVIVGSGETDLTKLNSSCLIKASQRRTYEQQRK
jgi:hypothetical protein